MSLPYHQLLAALLIGHAIADYPLQGDFLAKAKNHRDPIPGINWCIAMAMHCLIHGGAVWLITGSFFFGMVELIIHFIIDVVKCEGLTGSPRISVGISLVK